VSGLVRRTRARLGWSRSPSPPSAATVTPVELIRLDGRSPAAFAALLSFPEAPKPIVSVVVPALNKIEYTLCCLSAIERRRPAAAYEVIVVDDGSSDGTSELLSRVPGLRCLRNPATLGFVLSANRGALAARGDYILFLNNDTQVQEGWLDSLLRVFEADPRVGIAGSKLVYPSGHLQEAGTVIRGDGTVELVGLDDDPGKPEYNRPRPVDHCSGASLMIERSLFEKIGGFDERYAPAYYEDCDLSLKVRQAGRTIAYVPASVVVHHLSVTTAEGDQDLKRAQVEVNRGKLLERWGTVLEEAERVRAIAFYLPQFHPIPENDAWWGEGFTEWTSVARARPVFKGHLQPRLPAELGFYDLRVPDARQKQADLAAAHGLHGFCYYYYWFNGKRLLERPLREVLASGAPDFPFCLCWANENWTRRWDGREDEVLIAQRYSPEDDLRFIESLLPCFADRRYIRMEGRPLLLVYRAEVLPDARRTLARWREVCRVASGDEIYVASVESFGGFAVGDPRRFGFDAAVEFPPHGWAVETAAPAELLVERFEGRFYDYARTADNFLRRPLPSHPLLRAVTPSWDNSPRRSTRAHIFTGASPAGYEHWLRQVVDQTRQLRFGDERTVFINAWNEWGEGCHLEPDQHHGRGYLEATRRALGAVRVEPRGDAVAAAPGRRT
jgi:GT2 family glycosyltransferase